MLLTPLKQYASLVGPMGHPLFKPKRQSPNIQPNSHKESVPEQKSILNLAILQVRIFVCREGLQLGTPFGPPPLFLVSCSGRS